MRKQQLFSAGDFANIFNISKQTLLYYDKIGVFSPCERDEKGYRYYSFEQVDILATILTLKEIISLGDVKDYTARRDTEYFIKLFEGNIIKLDRQIELWAAIRDRMSDKVSRVKKAHTIQSGIGKNSIYTEYCDEEYLKLSPVIPHGEDNRKSLEALGYIIHYRTSRHLNFDRAIGGIVSKSVFLAHDRNEYTYYYAALQKRTDDDAPYVKPQGNYLIYYHQGHYELAYTSYEKLIAYAEAQGYTIGENIYEESIVDEVVETNADNYIVKISVPVF